MRQYALQGGLFRTAVADGSSGEIEQSVGVFLYGPEVWV
jgi:hypothetical protein